jgi:hypothetical protein
VHYVVQPLGAKYHIEIQREQIVNQLSTSCSKVGHNFYFCLISLVNDKDEACCVRCKISRDLHLKPLERRGRQGDTETPVIS